MHTGLMPSDACAFVWQQGRMRYLISDAQSCMAEKRLPACGQYSTLNLAVQGVLDDIQRHVGEKRRQEREGK